MRKKAKILSSTGVTIATTQIRYQYTTTEAGSFVLYFAAEFNSGADKRRGVIEFVVRKKEAH